MSLAVGPAYYAGLPTRFEIAADMASCLLEAVERDGFDLGDERCIHAYLDHVGFDPVDVDDADLIEAAVERARRLGEASCFGSGSPEPRR